MSSFIYASPIMIGFIIDLFLGDPYSLPHPVRLIGTLIARLEMMVRKRFERNLRTGGIIISVIVLTISTAVPLAILFAFYKMNLWLGIAV